MSFLETRAPGNTQNDPDRECARCVPQASIATDRAPQPCLQRIVITAFVSELLGRLLADEMVGGGAPVNTLWQNLRYAVRMLAKYPGFTAVTVLTLALGIGANTAIFSVVYSALLRQLPYYQPEKLFKLAESRQQHPSTDLSDTAASYPDFLDWKRTAKSFQALAASSGDAFTLTGNGDPKLTNAAQATTNFFSTLGVKPVLGRDFIDGDQQYDSPRVTMLTYALWRSEFGGDPMVIGRTIRLDDKPATVIGILPKNFEYAPANSAALWVPLHPSEDTVGRRNLRWLNVVGRLAPGVSPSQAKAEFEGIMAQLAREYPKQDASTFFLMGSVRDEIVGKIRPLLLVLFGAVGFVLLIACANVANLLMTRSTGRRKEFAIRAALGAGRSTLLLQLLTESVMLSFIGAALGLLGAQWGVSALVAAIPESQLRTMPYLRDAGLNLPVLLFSCAVTFATGILFGLAPALSIAQSSVNDVLKDESRGGTSAGHARLRNTLVVAEIAISLVLLVGAGLMLRSLRTLLQQDPGFVAHNVLTFSVNLPDTSYPNEKAYPYASPSDVRFEHQFTERLLSLPGVEGAGVVSGIPLSGGNGTIRFLVEGRPTPTGKEDECDIRTADATYFQAMKIPLVAGRYFSATDTWEAPWIGVVNQSFVKEYFHGDSPLGKRIRFTYDARNPWQEIVGVVGNVAEVDLAEPPPPVIYVPNDQGPSSFLSYVVRTSGDPAAFVGTAQAALHEIDSQLPLIQPQSLEQIAEQSPSVFLRRYPSYLIGSLAGLALILAMVGLYGLISYTVQQRTREIGIRVALGAQSRDILELVLRQGIGSVLAGVGIGIVAGLALTRLMTSLLYGVGASDGLTFASVSVLLLLVAVAACSIPAWRATRVDPLEALRHE
jgi:predicted permease